MSRCALGDRVAFARLYDLTSGHLFAVVLRIQRDRALAEDLLQEVYVNVWRAVGSFDARAVAADDLAHQRGAQQGHRSLRRAQSQPVLQSVHRDDEDDDRPDLDQQIADETAGPPTCCRRPAMRAGSTPACRASPHRSARAWRWPSSTACRMPRWRRICTSRWAP